MSRPKLKPGEVKRLVRVYVEEKHLSDITDEQAKEASYKAIVKLSKIKKS